MATLLLRLSILSNVALLTGLAPPKVPPATTLLTATLTVSFRSASVRLKVPLVLNPALVSVSPPVALSEPWTEMSGASLLPVMVMVTVCKSVPALALLSVPVSVYVNTRVSPWARKSKA